MAEVTQVMDRRQQKTRAALHGAFLELLLDQGYEAVTVGAVSHGANVGRSTFYEHYRTKDDLLRASIETPFATLAGVVDAASRPEALTDVLKHFRDHQRVARVLLSRPTRSVLSSALADRIAVHLVQIPQARLVIPAAVIARQVADMQLALIDAWIAGRPAFDVSAAAKALQLGTRALVTSLSY